MDAMPRLASPPQPERHVHRRYRLTAALVAVIATLAACGLSTPPQSQAQIATNDVSAGLAAQAAGNLSGAMTDYKNAISHDAHNKYAYFDLGDVEQLMGQAAAAEQNYRATLQLDPNFGRALYNLAILRTVPSPAEAEELYRHVISLQPINPSAHLNLGFLLRSERRIAEGNAELTIAVSQDPSVASRIPPGTLTTHAPATPSPTPHR
jgi:Tfp pilus assembly protein PilF